jgi:hypothetical protein
MKLTVVRLARIKGTLVLIGSQPFNESLNAPRYSVQDPALMCTSTGDGEQTINQIQTRGEHGRFIFFKWGHMFQGWRETLAMFLGRFRLSLSPRRPE